MRIQFLGTGDCAGWPNPFCECSACRDLIGTPEVRGQTSVLVDDVMLLDFGPDTVRSAMRFGVPLHGVRHILLGHAHQDHTHPHHLMARRFAGRTDPIDLIGPPDALAVCAPYITATDPVRQLTALPGESLRVGRYAVVPVKASHAGDAVLYDVTSPDDTRLLYATDTGLLSEPTLATLTGRRFDVVLLELTFGADPADPADPAEHLDATTFPAVLDELRRRDAITAGTLVVAVHVSHRHGSPAQLAGRLAGWGARVHRDGDVIEIGPPAGHVVAGEQPDADDRLDTQPPGAIADPADGHAPEPVDDGAFYALAADITDPTPAEAPATHRPGEAAAAASPRRPAAGQLNELAAWIACIQGNLVLTDFRRLRLVLLAADADVPPAAAGSRPAAEQAASIADGSDPRCEVARRADVEIEVTSITGLDPRRALRAGMDAADRAVDSGAELLVIDQIGAGGSTVAAAAIGVLLGSEPAAVTGRGGGIDDTGWMRKVVACRDLMRRGRPYVDQPMALLDAFASPGLAAVAGFVTAAAARRTPVLLGGVGSIAGALIAHQIRSAAAGWWLPGHRPDEPGVPAALRAIGLDPVLDTDAGWCPGALAAVPLLRAAALSAGS